jgi:hypothetical protein
MDHQMQNTNTTILVALMALLLTAALVTSQESPDNLVEPRRPLNPGFPLATKLTAWYRVIPALAAGKTWFTIAGNTNGVLTNMAASGVSGWGGTSRPGGSGEMRFSGTGYVLLGNPASLQVTTGACSFCLWVKITAPPPASPDDNRAPGIVALTDNGTGVTRALDLSIRPVVWAPDDGRAVFEAYDGTNNPEVVGDTSLVDAGWQHLCAIRGNGQLRLFQNALEVSGSPATDTTGSINTSGLAWAIGSRLDSNFGWAITGAVDDVMLFNGYALTTNDVQLIYQDSRMGNVLALQRIAPDELLLATPAARRRNISITNY